MKNNPGLVERFVRATMVAYKETEKNPDAAVNSMADIVGGTMAEESGKEQARSVLDVTLGILYSKDNMNRTMGLHVDSDWADMLGLMKKFNDLQTSKSASDFYTNQFIN